MRVSTSMMYTYGVARLSEIQASVVKTQQQLSTGKRILTPSDDPVGASRALDLGQSQSLNTQFAANRQNATSALSSEESVLQGTTNLLQDVKTLTISAGSGTLNDADRLTIANNIQSRLNELIGQANATDGTGNYLFSGYSVATAPFVATPAGATYGGDQGQRLVQVADSRQIPVGDSGDAVFQNVPSSGVYSAVGSSTNSASLTASPVTVSDATALKPTAYNISFVSSGGATTYTVRNSTSGIVASNAYISGQPIVFDGRQVTLTGTPGSTDTFSVRADTHQSVFKTLSDLVATLKAPQLTATDQANLTHGLTVAGGNLDAALDSVLTIRSSIGSRLNEIDSLNTSGDDRKLQLAATLSQIQDVDYTQAISDLTQQNTTLQAAQKSFVQISNMSLFSYLP